MFELKGVESKINEVKEFIPGSKSISAGNLNTMTEAIKEIVSGKSGMKIKYPEIGSKILIKNEVGAKITAGDFLYTDGKVLNSDKANYKNQVISKAYKIDEDHLYTDNVCVSLEDIGINKFGYAAISGACVAKVDITDINHTHCIPAEDSLTLTSSYYGNIKIIYKPDGVVEDFCIISLATVNPYPQVFKSISAPDGTVEIKAVDINGDVQGEALTFTVLPSPTS